MNKQERLDLANLAIKYSIKQGADQVSVSISKRRKIEIEHRDKKLEKIQESTQNSLNIEIMNLFLIFYPWDIILQNISFISISSF